MSYSESNYERKLESRPLYKNPPSLIAFTLAILVLCVVAFTIVCLCRYCFISVIHTWAFQRTTSGSLIRLSPNRSPPRGLNPSLLQIFPTFLYGNVKDLRKENYNLECAICLVEFEDDSMLRLLTICCHVFHQECIDSWLRSNKTCPICRRDLDSPTTNQEVQQKSIDNEESDDDVHIDMREAEGGDEESERDHRHKHEHECEHKHDEDYKVFVSISGQQHQHEEEQRVARSHSTGHSIVLIRGGEENDGDKYTLRLPKHVITRHIGSRSCSNYREVTRPISPDHTGKS
ncbi:hypothetical protein RIF29_33197 [Crotalaria pallida]|uniref:RING-type E3 ubiquitin transferase n=1 Tax=Crotalaria pallida TaxID=3830 RepID=A0AAN9E829_CROPI